MKDIFVARNLFLPLLFLGVLIRLPSLCHPIDEGHRNAQTATLTAGMIENGRLRLDPIAPWRGDLDARLVQELPVYNLCVLALAKMPGLSLDGAGRSVSLIFWALGFWLLQKLWSQALPKDAHFWANLLFVLAPMSWYLSTAFMPETLVQLLSITFILLVIRYSCRPSSATAAALVFVAGLGLLIKLPSFAHLGIFLILVLVDRGGWRALLNPILIMGALIILASLLAWSRFIESVNTAYFSYWTGRENLIGFLQPNMSRLSPSFWTPLIGYNLSFILPMLVAPFAAIGFWRFWHARNNFLHSRTWLYLLASLLTSWLIWAKGPAAQSYYNLPNLIVFSAAFGMGVCQAEGLRVRISLLGRAVLVAILVVSSFAGYLYLSRPDCVTVEVAQWIRTNTDCEDIILYQPRHAAAVMDYEHQPLLSHLTGKRTWIWTRSTPEWERDRSLKTSNYLIVTNPEPSISPIEALRISFKGPPPPPPSSISLSNPKGFLEMHRNERFVAYAFIKK